MPLEVKIRRKLKGFALDVSFRTDREVMGLLGASGSGKSMTLRCIAGIDKPDEGRIVLNGEVLYDSEKKISLPPQKRKIGYLFQNYALFPTMTAEENIGISLKCPGDEKAARVAEMIRKYRLEGLEKRTPAELSGGQQQRVALARMLITDPKVIMAHYDVVPVNQEEWSVPAFDAVLKDGCIWGRGTLDTKGTLIPSLEAIEQLLKDGFVPENDLYFSFSGEEEIDGASCSDIVSRLEELHVRPAFVLDEGGAIVSGAFPGMKEDCAAVGIVEKGSVNLDFTIEAPGGHEKG